MEYRQMGQSDIKLSEISLGCWVMGGDYWGGAEDTDSISAIHRAVDLGVNFIDTAELYGWGRSEEVLGKAIQGLRQKVTLSSKVWRTNMGRDAMKKACEDSLKRLGTDYLDIYFLHYPSLDAEVTLEESMQAMGELKKEGKIREIGLSNFSRDELTQALSYGRFEVVQPCYSLLWRFMEADILPFCVENKIGVVIYSPLAQGILTGKFTEDWEFQPGDKRGGTPLFLKENFRKGIAAAQALKPYAEAHGKTIGQTAINWAISKPGITSAIVGARNARQMEENAGAAGWSLSPEEWMKIDRIGLDFFKDLPRYENMFSQKIIEN